MKAKLPGVPVVILLFLLMATGASTAYASIFTVNVTNDPDPVAAPNGCSSPSINGGRCSLREAVIQANAAADTDTIMLGEATYQLTQTGSNEEDSLTGDLDFTQDNDTVTVQGKGMDKTIIDAAIMADGIFQLQGQFSTLSFDGIFMKNGNRNAEPFSQGAAVGIGGTGDTTITITNCRFEGNQALLGGAVAVKNSSTATIKDSIFVNNNRATSVDDFSGGGAIRLGESSDMTVENVVISGNNSTSDGGGILVVNSGHMTMKNCEISKNTAASEGGGVYASSGAIVDLDTGSVTENKAIDGGGFFIKNGSFSEVYDLTNVTVANNTATGNGGAIFGSSGPHVTFRSSTISGNKAAEGGAFFTTFGFTLDLNNSTVAENSATNGGGIAGDFGAVLNLRNATFFNNTAQTKAGGIFSKDLGFTVSTANSAIAGNTVGGATSDCDGVPTTTTSGLVFNSGNYNVFGDLDACVISLATNDKNGVNDPKLNDLADNGGLTLTDLPQGDSPVLNAGNPGGCVDTDGAVLTVDQRGQTRPSGACDVGSVQLGESNLSIAKTADTDSVAVGEDLTYTLTIQNKGPDNNLQVNVTDTLPAGVTLGSVNASQGACAAAGATVSCDLGAIPNGGSVTVEIVVTAPNTPGTITNTATVTGSELDPDDSNNTDSVQTTVTGGGGGGGCLIAAGTATAAPWPLCLALAVLAGFAARRRSR